MQMPKKTLKYRKMLFSDWFHAYMINTRFKFSKVISTLIKQFTEIMKWFPLEVHFIVSTMRAKKRPRLVTKIIVLTSWGGVAALCVPCPDHLSITQRSRGRGWGREWRTSSTHTHWRPRCRCSEARLAAAQPWMRPLRIDLHTNKKPPYLGPHVNENWLHGLHFNAQVKWSQFPMAYLNHFQPANIMKPNPI